MMKKLMRSMARANMERAGMKHINKPVMFRGHKLPSTFAQKWRDYAVVPERILKACQKDQDKQAARREARNSRRRAASA